MSEANGFPTIADAKALAMQYRRPGVIVLSFGAGNFHAASYGMTRKQCDAMRGVVNQLFALIGSGEIEVPDGFGKEPVEAAGTASPVDPLPLITVCWRVVTWLDRLAKQSDQHAETTSFETLRQACRADARNYRATAADIRSAIARATGAA